MKPRLAIAKAGPSELQLMPLRLSGCSRLPAGAWARPSPLITSVITISQQVNRARTIPTSRILNWPAMVTSSQTTSAHGHHGSFGLIPQWAEAKATICTPKIP